jgi:hypothetical protein
VVKTDVEGRQVTERSFIEDVSDFGCRFSISGAIAKGDAVVVKVLGLDRRPLRNEPSRQFEIMWVQRKGNNSTVGGRMVNGPNMDKAKLAAENSPLVDGTQREDH